MKSELSALLNAVKSKDRNRTAYFDYYTERDLSVLLKHLPKKCSVLDVGGGYGRLALPLAKKGFSVTVLDPLKELLEIAEERKLKTVKGVIEKIPFKNNSFDAVIAMRDVLNYSKNYRKGFSELVRVCRRGGIIVVSCGSICSTPDFKRKIGRHDTGEGFSMMHFSTDNLLRLFRKAQLKVLEITGDSIILPLLKKNAYRLLKDRRTKEEIENVDRSLSKDINALNFFDHIMIAGKKP